jgi:hypothetical protein
MWCSKCCLFCGGNESIDHLFFSFPSARYIWNVVSIAFSFKRNFSSVQVVLMCGSKVWKVGIGNWRLWWLQLGIWESRNLACFQKKWHAEPICVIFKICYWLIFGALCWWRNTQRIDYDGSQSWWSGSQLKCSARGGAGRHGFQKYRCSEKVLLMEALLVKWWKSVCSRSERVVAEIWTTHEAAVEKWV